MSVKRHLFNHLQRKFIIWLLALVGGGSAIGGFVDVIVSVMVFTSAQTGYMKNSTTTLPPIEDIPIISTDIIFPLDDFRVTCGFTCYANHNGMDMSGGYGAIVRAVKDGVVEKVTTGFASNGGYLGHPGGYGNNIIINHGDGTKTRYAHMQDTITLKVGDPVVIGQVIGLQGNSGNSSGSHLHFEWYENGVRIDPMTRLPFDNLGASNGQNKPLNPSNDDI